MKCVSNKWFVIVILIIVFIFKSFGQDHHLVAVTNVVLGNETSCALFSAKSSQIPSLAYIRAQKLEGSENGIFTINGDNIRYISLSSLKGIPDNLSIIRFTFLKSDQKTLIPPSNLRFIINDIDGPNNEALSTNCNENLKSIGTSSETNLILDNNPPSIDTFGAVEENEGPTSRVMFEFIHVTSVEFENYGNEGYLKDFDLNDDYPIAEPIYLKCKKEDQIIFKHDSIVSWSKKVISKERGILKIDIKPIYFDNDKYSIRKDGVSELVKVEFLLKKFPKLKVEIRSHTDSKEDDSYNLKLSRQRTNSVLSWLFNKGINPFQLTGKGYGESKLVNKCSNGVLCTEEEHQLNRRTEFVILNPEVVSEE
ncbi:OmpA family protein [Lutibacter citreus]|uniref:OmpA family protein n=1 Tax=Lutibacter citreus TaxID=2138210 RepID=UPI000DBE1C16|nr:OmpA family protein [Lutibacter citreus]